MAEAERPPVYFFLSHHELRKRVLTLDPPDVLAHLMELHGSLPDELDTEALLCAFADAGCVALADAEIEPAIVHPHRLYASRPWLQAEYCVFLEWCLVNGWLDVPVARRVSQPLPTATAAPAAEAETDPVAIAHAGVRQFFTETGLADALEAMNGPTVEDEPEPTTDKPKKRGRTGA